MNIHAINDLSSEFPEWEWAIVRSCEKPEERWMAQRFILKLREHKARYPAFIEWRVAEIFFSEPNAKIRSFYCFQPVSHFTKKIHKNKSIFKQAEAV
jgi:hypothetical protein